MATGITEGVGQYDHVKETFVIYRKTGVVFLANNIVEVAGNSEERTAARKAASERKKSYFSVKSVEKLTR